MKIVKVCPECKKYNNYKLSECAFCGANLNDDTLEVNDDEELKAEVKTPMIEENVKDYVSSQEEFKDVVEQEKGKDVVVRICPMCGSEESDLWCENCGMFLDGEEVKVVKEKSIQIKELNFTLNSKNQVFEYVANEDIKYIGRHDFDSLNDEDLISVSRSHLEYYLRDSQLYFKDISTYGSYLNNVKMEKGKEYLISNKDIVKLVYFDMEIKY